jgi:colanic acid biosynthesis glycosyl transferase WcaI
VHILFINQFFHPDTAATAQLLTDLATSLTAWGHSITVVCGQSDYTGTTGSLGPNVEVVRVGNRRFSRDTKSRLASYATFLAGALQAAFRVRKPDIVVTLTTPPFVSAIGTMLKRHAGVRHYIWEMDLYPDVAADLELLGRRSAVTRALAWFSDAQRRQADGIIVLGECMRERIESHGISPERIHVCENWADSSVIRPMPLPSDGILRVLYSGNFGLAHDADTIQSAMKQLRGDPRFHFIFGGGGPLRAALDKYSALHGLSNITLLPYQTRDKLSAMLGSASLGLVTQRPECAGSVVPSKVYGLMAARRPFLFIGPRAATPARLIAKFGCGWQIDPSDSAGLVALLDVLAKSPQLVQRAGERAHVAFLHHYNLATGVARIAKVLGIQQPVSMPKAKAVA